MSDVDIYLKVNDIKTSFDRAFEYILSSARNGNKNGVLNGLAAARRNVNELEELVEKENIDWAKPILHDMQYKINKVSMEVYILEENQKAMVDALSKGDTERLKFLERNFENFKFEFLG